MLRDRCSRMQFNVLLLAFFAGPILGNDDLMKACDNEQYKNSQEPSLAYQFCRDVFPQLFTSEWNTAYQALLPQSSLSVINDANETIFNKCEALKLMTSEWTVGLLERQGRARERLMEKWQRLMEKYDGPDKLKELIFLACAATFPNEPNVIYIDWPDEIIEDKKCPELTEEPSKFDELQSMIREMDKMTTKDEAEKNRKKASYEFCHALFSDKFNGEWSPEKSVHIEEWSLGMDVSLVEGCRCAALLQPEVRMMREMREVNSELRKQLGKYLFWPLNTDAKESEAIKDATLKLCKFAFLLKDEAGFPLWAIVAICVAGALLLLTLIIVIACCAWRSYRRKKKAKEEAELAWAQMMMGGEQQSQREMPSTKRTQTQGGQSIETVFEDSTVEDSARTIDMMPSEENLPQITDVTMEEGSDMKTAMMAI